ncbi:MAG: hypothetical protein ACR2H9_09495 [Longimicrobiaceae bacterium]
MSKNDICFVIMPYGVKKDVDGQEIDFNEIYDFVIKEAVELVDGIQCLRCDDIDKPGWIHERMLTNIFEARVAVVDTSTLNANVFYELGVRHALRKGVTVLIRRKGTTSPFNIEGFNSIEYSTSPKGVAEVKKKIRDAIVSALDDPANVDSLVYQALPGLQVQRGPVRAPKRLMRVQTFDATHIFPSAICRWRSGTRRMSSRERSASGSTRAGSRWRVGSSTMSLRPSVISRSSESRRSSSTQSSVTSDRRQNDYPRHVRPCLRSVPERSRCRWSRC